MSSSIWSNRAATGLLAFACAIFASPLAHSADLPSVYYARVAPVSGVTPKLTLTGVADGTTYAVTNASTGASLGQGTLDRMAVASIDVTGATDVRIETSEPLSVTMTAGCCGTGGTIFYPSDDFGLRAGTSFVVTPPQVDASNQLVVYAFDAADVTVRDAAGTVVDQASMAESSYWEPLGLSGGQTYEITADGIISVQTSANTGYDSVPDRFGNDVGYDFLTSTGPLGGVAVFAYENAVVAALDLDDGSLVLFETVPKGTSLHVGDLSSRHLWVNSNAKIAVWAGDHDATQDIAHLGDDIALNTGVGGMDIWVHTQAQGAVVFAGTPGTQVKVGAQTYNLGAGGSANLAPGALVHITSNFPVVVQTTGGDSLVDYGVALRALPAGKATSLEVLPSATEVPVGEPLAFTIMARDGAGFVDIKYNGTVSFTATDPSALLPQPYVFGYDDKGQHTFPDTLHFLTTGPQTLTAKDTAQPTIKGTATVTVLAGPFDAEASLISASPTSLDANGVGASVVKVTPTDSYGNAIGAGHTVVIAATEGTLEGSVADVGDGTYTQTLRAPLVAATAMVTATVDGEAIVSDTSVTFKKDSTPPGPVLLSASNATETTVTLTWGASASPDVASYTVIESLQGGTYGAGVDVGDVTTHAVTGLTGCTLYSFQVIPTDTVGNVGVASNATQVKTTIDGPPAAPAQAVAQAFDTYAILTWDPSSECDFKDYSVSRSETQGGPYTEVAANLSAPKLVAAGLTNDTTYYYVLYAHDLTGLTSAASAEIPVTPHVMDPGPPVQGLTAKSLPGGKVKLDWLPPTEGDPVYFTVYRDGVAIGDPTVGTFTDTPPAEGSYDYVVTWFDYVDAESQQSAPVTGLSDATGPSCDVTLLPVPPVGVGERIVTITASEPLGQPPILSWKVGTTSMAPPAFTSAGGDGSVWKGTLVVPAGSASGTATLTWSGADVAGNIGTVIDSGATFAVDGIAPSASIALSRPSPVSAGALGITLTTSEPLVGAPTLTWGPELLVGEVVPLVGAGTVWTGEITIVAGPNDGNTVFAWSGTDGAGNVGTAITAGKTFVVDTTPPEDPQTLLVLSAPKGAFNLVWGTSPGGGVAAYHVYRSDAAITTLDGLDLVGQPATNKLTDLPPSDGTWYYAIQAVDAAGNKSGFITSSGTSDQTPPEPPTALDATVQGSQVSLAWQPPQGATSVTYKVYRSLTSFGGSVAGKAPVGSGLTVPTGTDTPASDADYYYVVTAADVLQNESGPSNEVMVHFDAASPVITISGVQAGKHYKAAVTPTVSASDFTLQSTTSTVDGAPWQSGTPIAAEGDHELMVVAEDSAGHKSQKKVAFTIDLTPPDVQVSGVESGQLYETAPSATVTATDAWLVGKTVKLDGGAYVEGSPIKGHGAHVLTATAEDKAGNKTTVSVSFQVDLPPAPVAGMQVTVVQGGSVGVAWTKSGEPDITGYRLLRDGNVVYEGAALVADGGAPPNGSERVELQVVAIDGMGHVGAPRPATIYPLGISLVEAGTALETGGTALTRGYLDQVTLQVQSDDPEAMVVGPLDLELLDDQQVDWWSHAGVHTWPVSALSTVTIDDVVSTHEELTDVSALAVALTQPSVPGTSVKLVASFPVDIRWKPGSSIDILPETLLRGFEGNIAFELHNHGSADLDVVAAMNGGLTTDVVVSILTPDGEPLDSAKTWNQDGAPWVGQYNVATLEADGSYTFGPATLIIPVDAPDSVIVKVDVLKTYSGYGSDDQRTGPVFTETALVSVVPPPYEVTATTDKDAYKAGEKVMISGLATYTATGLPAPNEVVKVIVSRKGFQQTVYTKTDATGVFVQSFLPTPGVAGVFNVSAAHPGVVYPEVDASFAVHGLTLGPLVFNVSLLSGTSYTSSFTLTNKGETAITGIAANVVDPVPDDGVTVSVTTAPPVSLAAGKSSTIKVKVTADATALGGSRAFGLVVTSAEESSREATINAAVTVPAVAEEKVWPPVLYVTPQWLDLSLVAGKSDLRTVKVKNSGNGAWTGVKIGLPTTAWINVTTELDLGDVQPGETRSIDILFLPPKDTATGVVQDTLWMQSDNYQDIPLNMTLKVTSSNKGQVLAKVTNYVYALTAPDTPVPGAQVTLQSQTLYNLKFSGTAGPDGTVLFQNVPEGAYKYIVQASGFQTLDSASLGGETGVVQVQGGQTALVEVALVESFVDVGWSVTPTTVEDEYDISVETTFETKVPTPVLNILPAQQGFSIQPGSSQTGQLEIINLGLVSAWDVKIGFQQSEYLDVQFATSVIPEVKAQSSIIVPFTVFLKTHGSPPAESCTDYSLTGDVTYMWYCDTAGNWVKMPVLPFGINVKSNAAKVTMGPNVITRSTYYNCPGFTNGQSVTPPNVTLSNGDSGNVTICDCGRMTTSGIGLPTLKGLLDALLGKIADKAGDLVGQALQKAGVPSWEDITEAAGQDAFGDDWDDVKNAKEALDNLMDQANKVKELIDIAMDATCEDQGTADNIKSALTALANEAADKALNYVLEKYTGGLLSFNKAYTKFDKLCLTPGGSASADVPEQSHSFGLGTMSASVAKGCGPDHGACCPVSVGYVDYTVICLPGGGSSSQSGGGGGGGGGWGGWGGGGGGSSTGWCTK